MNIRALDGYSSAEASRQILIERPDRGEQVSINLNLKVIRHLDFDLAGATAEVSDGKILVTLSNGGMLIYSGAAVGRFLNGPVSLEQILPLIKNGTASWDMDPAQIENGSAGFRHLEPYVPLERGHSAAGPLSGTVLPADFPEHAQEYARSRQLGTATPTNRPPVAQDDSFSTGKNVILHGSVLTNDSDPDGDALNAALVIGPNHGNLALDADGSFAYTPALDYSGPDSFSYRASDSAASSNVATVIIDVSGLNSAPVSADDNYKVTEDGVLTVVNAGILTNDTDVDGDKLAASVISGPNHGVLALNPAGGFVYTPAPDFNGDDSFTYQASDGNTVSNPATVTIVVVAVNDAPTGVSFVSGGAVNENSANGTAVGSVHAADPDSGDILTYSLSDSASGRFAIDPSTGAITVANGGLIDFESNNSHDVTVVANDGTLTSSTVLSIAVTNVNEVPTDIALTGSTVAENAAGAVIGALTVVDPDAADTHGLTVSDARFEVVADQLKLKAGISLDFETAPSVTVDVTATDKAGLTRTETFGIAVTNVNEVPTDIALTGSTVAENAAGAVIGALTVVDPDAADTHGLTASDARFEVVADQLKLKAGISLDFEAEPSVTVDVTTTDKGGLARTETFAITVTNVNEAPTDIALIGSTVAENMAGAVIGALTVVDPDAADTHGLTVSDARFEVVADQLKLKAGISLDFETEPSVNVDVTATDKGGLTRTEIFGITVTNVNEAPTDIALIGSTLAENMAGAVIGALTVIDPDAADTHGLTVSDARFEVVADQLKLKAGISLDFEAEPSVNVDVTATDKGGLARTETFGIAVTNVNEVPTDIALIGSTVAENMAGAVIGALTVVDPDAADTHSLTVSDARFEVVADQLKLKAGISLDFEVEPSVNVDVTATDKGGLTRTETFGITVTNMNEVPTDIALTGSTVAENTAGAVIGALTVIDPDAADTHGLTVSDARFEVVADQLKLKAGISLDFEAEPSVNVDVTATDKGGLGRTETFAITVTNGNDPPIAVDDSASVPENGFLIGATVLFNDSDLHGGAPGENNTPLTAVLNIDATGDLTLNPDGTYTYTPVPGFEGIDSFTYHAEDALGGLSNVATVTITVVPPAMVLVGDTTANTLTGGNGDDTISGLSGDDTLSGGKGNDSIDAGTGNDSVDGGSGNDIILGDTGNDVIVAGTGDDSVNAGTGDDIANGGSGDDRIDGDTGDDILDGGSGNDQINGGTGSDKIDGGDGDDTLAGNEGFDLLIGGSGSDSLSGGTDNDILSWDPTDKLADGGADIDTLLINSGDLDLGSANVISIESVDLGASNGANMLTLTAASVIALSDNDILIVLGGADDRVDAGGGWVDGGVAGSFQTYTQLGATLVVDTAIAVNTDILI